MSRRNFALAATAAGLSISKPEDLAAADTTWEQAVVMSYFAFWGAAGGRNVAEDPRNPTPDYLARLTQFNGDLKNPNDGHDGPIVLNKPHNPNRGKNKGPMTAREWLIWRVIGNFQGLIMQWELYAPYALSNSARMGVIARQLADQSLSDIVLWDHAFGAFYLVRDKPLRKQIEKIESPFDKLCE